MAIETSEGRFVRRPGFLGAGKRRAGALPRMAEAAVDPDRAGACASRRDAVAARPAA